MAVFSQYTAPRDLSDSKIDEGRIEDNGTPLVRNTSLTDNVPRYNDHGGYYTNVISNKNDV